MIDIVPSILTNDLFEAKELIARCEGKVERISVDVIDGKFADNKTITPDLLSDLDTSLKIDYQLMVNEPINWVEKCVRGQADRIIGHVEMMNNKIEFLSKVSEVGVKVGMAVDLGTSISDIDQSLLTNLDVILVMSVKAGFGGQSFDDRVIDKIKKLNEIRKKDATPYKIHVDGGINFDNISKVAKAGADEVSIGRSLFKGDLEENVEKFKDVLRKLRY